MNKKLLKNGSIITFCLVLTFVYYQYNTESTKKASNKPAPVNYQTVVLKDKEDTLVPIEVDMQVKGEPDQIYRTMLSVMQSEQYQDIGLEPLLPKDLEVNSMDIQNKVLTFDFNDSLCARDNKDALDILEGLSYVFCNNEIEKIKLKINDQEIAYIPNSTIPVSCLNNNLGINNFDSDTNTIYKTVPVVVYNQKIINDKKYFVPTTTRIQSDIADVNLQVALLLDKIEAKEPVSLESEVELQEGVLQVNVSSNVLLDNETMDSTLYQQLVKSLESIQGVDKVSIFIDKQEQTNTINVSNELNNRIKM